MIHGGDIYRNDIELDFSVSVNPLGIPEGVKKALHESVSRITCYPDSKAEKLKQGIEERYGVDREHILCGSGASELFMAIFHGLRPGRTVIPVPSFSGYEYAARAVNSKITYLPMAEEQGFCFTAGLFKELSKDTDLLILANPNNPVGNLIEPVLIRELLQICRQNRITVIIDECFLEFTGKDDTDSLKREIEEYPDLIVVRAFTKIYGIPGIRLGYLFCANKEILSLTERQLPEWNLSVLTQEAGIAALKEEAYLIRTAEYIKMERQYLSKRLIDAGMKVFSSETNFLLFQTKIPLSKVMLKKKILVRDCSGFKGLTQGYYRIAVKSRIENEKFLQALEGVLTYA